MSERILWHVRPIWWNRQAGWTQPDIVVQLYSVPIDASCNEVVIYASNTSQSWQSDYIWIWTHIQGEAHDDTDYTAIALYQEIKGWQTTKFDWIKLADWDSIRVYSNSWLVNFTAYGDEILAIAWLKAKVIAGTASGADKEKLMLLTWWAYVIQTNTNNCNCP